MSERFDASNLLSLDWWFRDRESGEVVLAQFPNAPLWIFGISVIAGWLTEKGSALADALHGLGTVGLAWWAIDEMIRGVNPWRRLLGLAGFIFVPIRVAGLLG